MAISEIDRRILSTLSGSDRMKALLADAGHSLTSFARKHNLWVQEVSRCIAGKRNLDEIRSALARELNLSRDEVDSIIDK